jgi:1,4-dihydroxy-2-naphthoyl-CoA hydrolase
LPPDQFLKMMPFAAKLGIELDSATADEVVGRLRWQADLCTAGGVLHGGALMAFAVTLGAVCAFLNLPSGAGTATTHRRGTCCAWCARAR